MSKIQLKQLGEELELAMFHLNHALELSYVEEFPEMLYGSMLPVQTQMESVKNSMDLALDTIQRTYEANSGKSS